MLGYGPTELSRRRLQHRQLRFINHGPQPHYLLASWAYRFAAAAATAVSMRSHGLLEGPVPTALFFLQFRCPTLNDVVIFAPQKKGRHVSILAPVLLLGGGFIEGVPMRRHCRNLNKISP